ncbi:MAG TPA: hypothetical protein VGP70_15740 [Actinomadura sp.]|jgi:hypothetical protein|nr:hypothetical protein [Actinomadura sp.]
METILQSLQIFGAVLILIAYILGQLQRLDPKSYTYLALNLIGSAVLAVLAAIGRDWGFLLLEGVWAAVSLISLCTRLAHRHRVDRVA